MCIGKVLILIILDEVMQRFTDRISEQCLTDDPKVFIDLRYSNFLMQDMTYPVIVNVTNLSVYAE